jgi:hypothetical protein
MDHVPMQTLVDRLGRDRLGAFVARLRQEGTELLRRAAGLGRDGGQKFENLDMLDQARQDAAAALEPEDDARG